VRETGTNPQAPDGPADNGRTVPPEAPKPGESGESGAEQPADRPQDQAGTEQPGEDATGTADGGTTGDAPAVPQEGEPAQPGNETRETAAGGTAPESGTDNRRNTDDALPPSEGTDQSAGAPEPPGEDEGDHGKNGQDNGSEQDPEETNRINPEAPEPVRVSTPPDRETPQSGENRDPGGELAPQRENPVEAEPGRFSGKMTITIDSDGRPILPDREPTEPEVGTRGRGEFGSPENDPADRDPRKEDSERLSRRREFRRGIFDQPGDVKKSVDTLADPIRSSFDRVPPTGQHSGVHNNADQFKSPHHPLQAGNTILAAAGAAIIMLEGTRRGTKVARQLMRRNHDNNR
jgi:hypothetical protein